MSDGDGESGRLVGENEALRRRVAALEAESRRYRTTLYSISDAVIATDAAGNVAQMNHMAETLTGWTEAGAKGRPISEVFRIVNEEIHAEVESPVARVLRDGMVVGLANSTLLIAMNGTEHPIADSGAPIRDEKGEVTGVVLVFRDQTEERAAQTALQEEEERFRTFFDNAPIGKSMTAPDGRMVRVNPALCNMLGYTADELTAMNFASITHPEDLAETRECVRSLLAGKCDVWNMDKRYLTKDGRIVWAQVTTCLLRDATGRPLHLLTHVQDITGRKRVEEALARSQEKLRAVIDATPFPVAVVDLDDDRIHVWSRSALELFGHTATTAAEWYKIAYPDPAYRAEVVSRWKPALEEAHRTCRPVNTGEYRVTCRDGSERICELYATFLAEDLIVTFNDITERKGVQQEIESLARFPGENPNPILRVGRDGKILYANESSHSLLAPWNCTVGDEVPLVLQETLARAFSRQEKLVQDVHVLDRIFSILIAPIAGLDYANLYGRDITDTARAQTEILRLNAKLEQRVVERTAQLEESNQELEAFSYSVSHDLRAPLRAIDGFTRILLDDYEPRLDTEGKRICAVIRENTERMGRLIDDLLAFSRLGRVEMQPSRIDMGTMASSVFHELTTPESQERIDFQIRAVPASVGDPSLIRQVWANLLSNAIKFTSKRQRAIIKVSGEQTEHETTYAVQDNGAGFDMKYARKLFGVFERLHSSKEFEGTGVGLAIVQRVIRRHGGRVWAEGETDRGARFHFALPQEGT